jgi:oxygen-independent coproporphyrinogen-3 oxidase
MGVGPISGRQAGNDAPSQARFLDALEKEITLLPAEFAPEVVYFGGGTPTELSLDDLKRLLALVRERPGWPTPSEWTVEANPGTLTPEKARALAAAGVTRVSLGVQSFQPRVLEFLGRFHRAPEIAAAVEMLRAAGIRNLSLDIIFAVPGTTLDDTRADLDALLELEPGHVSCYCLEYEAGSDLTLLLKKGFLRELPDDLVAAQYECIRDTLAGAGVAQYEISNFARPGAECRYNAACWAGGEYRGCGPAAFSHVGGERFENVPSLHAYCARLAAGRSPVHYRERLAPEARARELLVTGLRRTEGWDPADFQASTGFDAIILGGGALARLLADGLVERIGGRLRLTRRAMLISDGVFTDLI